MEESIMWVFIIAGVVNLIIFYLIIRAAVSSATQELASDIRMLLRLKTLELERAGISQDDIYKPELQRAALDKEFEEGKITYGEYAARKKNIGI